MDPVQHRAGRIARRIHGQIGTRARTIPAQVTDVSPRWTRGYVWATVGTSTQKVFARTLDQLNPGDTILVRKMTRDRTSFWLYDGLVQRQPGFFVPGVARNPGYVPPPYPAPPPPPPVTSALYFCPGYNFGRSTGYQLWRYDGTSVDQIWDTVALPSFSSDIPITLLAYSLTSRKLLICVLNTDNYIGNPDYPASVWQEGANEIYEYDPAVGGDPVKIAEFNYADADFGSIVQFGCAAEIGGKIYFGMADYTYDAHVVRFDPLTHTTELVDPLFQPDRWRFDDEWSGIIGEAGGTIYWMRSKTLRMSGSGDLGTWSDGPDLGTFDANNYYYYPDAGYQATDRLYLGTAWSVNYPGSGGGIAVMSIAGGAFNLEFRTGYPDHGDDESLGPFVTALRAPDGGVTGTFTIPRAGVNDSFDPANVWTNAGGGWGWDGSIPTTPRGDFFYGDNILQAKPLCGFQGGLYALLQYNDATGFGHRLVRRDGPGAGNWSTIRNFPNYDTGDWNIMAMTAAGTTIPVQSQ